MVTRESSVIKDYKYSPTDRTLTIRFQNGSVYRYDNISVRTFTELEQAPSRGRYFNQHIRPLKATRILRRVK